MLIPPLPPRPKRPLPVELVNVTKRFGSFVAWQPFYEGVEIHRLYGDGVTGPSAALLRFQAGGKVPRHAHIGYEHILVLHGSQRDQNRPAAAGTLMINPPGTAHSVASDEGCIALAIYVEPGRFSKAMAEETAPRQ